MNHYKSLAKPIVEIDYRKYNVQAWRLRAGIAKYIERHSELRMAVIYTNKRLFLVNKRRIHASDIEGAINKLLDK